ncbi:MAG: fatty acid desaturase [Pseudomonadota bacterium]
MSAPASVIDHKAAIARLTRTERERMLQKSDRAGLTQLAIHVTALGVAALGMHIGGWLWFPSLVAFGVLLVFLFTAQHECVHFTAFERRWINQAVARVIGALLFNPATWFRYFHLAHHRYTQDPDRDPELAEKKPDSWGAYVWHVLGWRVVVSGVKTVIVNAFRDLEVYWLPANQRAAVKREARVLLGIYAAAGALSVITGSSLIVEYWLLPLVVGQPALRLYLLAEHGRCAFVANMFENTRTTFTNSVIRRLAWNMPYHAEHHAFPSVPFHQLPSWHRHVRADLQCTSDGYSEFHRDYVKDMQ